MSYRSDTFIDKCSTTLPVDKSLWNTVIDNLFQAMNRRKDFTQSRGGNESKKFQIYHFAWHLNIGSAKHTKQTCFIQAYPTKEPTSFMRIEWNPSKIGLIEKRKIMRFLEICIPDFRTVWQDAFITRADITFDVLFQHLDQIYAFTQSAKTKLITYDHGFYLGVPKSERRLLIYDKRRKDSIDAARLASRQGDFSGATSDTIKTRFEFRFLRLGVVRDIAYFRNGLTRYSIALKGKAKGYAGDISWSRFLSNCERVGTQNALAAIADQKRRSHYRDILETNCGAKWFNKDIIWGEAMQRLGQALRI